MNIISKTFNTLAHIVDKRIATYKVAYDICSKCEVRDKVFIECRYFGNSNDRVMVMASDLLLRSLGVPVDYPSATCILPRVVEDGSNSYYICLSLCALNDPIVRNALVTHEYGHIFHKHLIKTKTTTAGVRQSFGLELAYEIEADSFACEYVTSDTLRKVIIDTKAKASSHGWTSRKDIETFDARLAVIDSRTASFNR